jgi:hypothetical protein
MLIVIQIILTVVAWRRGWKVKALLPIGIGAVLAFGIGLPAALAGIPKHDILMPLLLIDLGMFVSLVVMIFRKPKLRIDEPYPV